MGDKIKLGAAVALLCAGIAGYYLLAESPMIIRVAVVLLGAGLGALVAWTSGPGKEFYAFSQEAVEETRKVVWPTRKESLQTTGIVFLFVVVMGIFLWLVDASLLWVVKHLMGRSD